jgi:hypothetical protein
MMGRPISMRHTSGWNAASIRHTFTLTALVVAVLCALVLSLRLVLSL